MAQTSYLYYEQASGPSYYTQDDSLSGLDHGYMSSGERQEVGTDSWQPRTITGMLSRTSVHDKHQHPTGLDHYSRQDPDWILPEQSSQNNDWSLDPTSLQTSDQNGERLGFDIRSPAGDGHHDTKHPTKHGDSRQSHSSRSKHATDRERRRGQEKKSKQSHSSSSKRAVDPSTYQENDEYDECNEFGYPLSQGISSMGIRGDDAQRSMVEPKIPIDPSWDQAPANDYDVRLQLQTKDFGWRRGHGLRDSGNMAGHLLSYKMFRSLGYSSRDLDENMDLYGTLGGEIRTYGAISLDCYDEDRDSTSKLVFNVCEFAILEEYDVIFSRVSLPGASPLTGNPTINGIMRKRALTEDEKKQQKERIKAQEAAARKGLDDLKKLNAKKSSRSGKSSKK